ncbi:beta-galactosidase [Agaribacterium sp. ZY112]|uniref:beta-galactosidase n=1 Tax=Agaribacterium sp. ZY112 TaxID=3233574 RepID=UPI00352691AF
MAIKKALLLTSLPLALFACSEVKDDSKIKQPPAPTKLMIADFEDEASASLFELESSTAKRIKNDSGHAIELSFNSQESHSNASIVPTSPWNWSNIGDFNLSADISNPGDVSAHLYVVVEDITGWPHARTVSIPARSSDTYYLELKGPQLEFDSGLRENPPAWYSDDKKMFWLYGRKAMQLDAITKITYSLRSNNEDKSLIIDNIRLTGLPEGNAYYLSDIADKFGQSNKLDFPLKIHSDKQLKQLAKEELATLAKEGPMAGRSRFGGWVDGPKLEASGFYRTAKVDGKWAMVDPEGYLFFSSALANIRIANTTTLTGVDFKDDSVRYIDPEDVTPEDSLGIRPVSKEAQKTRYISSALRHNMFTWLPDYDDELANHYSYRRSSHMGPMKHGETFSFYQANLERRYGENYPDSYIDTWRDVTIKRFLNWGFTSTGNWTDASFYQMDRIPYFANGWIIGDFKTVTTGHDVWHALPDPFDPEFERRAKLTTEVIAEEVKNNPWCVGVFIDNEKSWGNMNDAKGRFGVATNTLTRSDSDSPTKAEFTRLLKEKYGTIDKLNAAWATDLSSWQELSEHGVEINNYDNSTINTDLSMLMRAYADQYFRIVHDALADVLPNHMYMGVRLAMWGVTKDVLASAANYVDVMSYNVYEEGLHPRTWDFLEEIDKPSIIGEFHIGATSDTGLYHPGLIHAADQADRARMYKEYMYDVIDNPYFVGAHWFQYLDSPLTGRAFDGENYNTGFVTVTDTPYVNMVEAAKEINQALYPRRFGNKSDDQH